MPYTRTSSKKEQEEAFIKDELSAMGPGKMPEGAKW